MSKEALMDILKEATTAEPIAMVNGKKVYDFQNAQKLNKADLVEEKALGKKLELGDRSVGENGLSYTSSNVSRAAIDPNTYFENRYRKIEQKPATGKPKSTKYEVVVDYRAIKEQASGRVYTDNVITFVIAKNEAGELVAETTNTISADEFVRDFKKKLSFESMARIIGAINKLENMDMPADELEL